MPRTLKVIQPSKLCENCSQPFTPPDSWAAKRQKYCGNSCARITDAQRRKLLGMPGPSTGFRHSDASKLKISQNNKSWLRKAEVVYRDCEQCGKSYQYSHNGSKPDRRFCSKSCGTKSRGSGESHPNWKGGRSISVQGYVMVHVNDGRTKDGWRPEHHIVMEKKLGRKLLPNENVHHKDRNRQNNDISNLELWTTGQPMGGRVGEAKHCPTCTCDKL